eukprot:TRINITY_DN10444_c0_g1_i1.p1 TRINITY_DN10444_c0_g1~~TRINITY_DN10444_c0_g1_i1.p1  ORF type:complete len:649 (+),score=128.43 TRINITY_DN10444_c0_g1_i1:60-2006(+)
MAGAAGAQVLPFEDGEGKSPLWFRGIEYIVKVPKRKNIPAHDKTILRQVTGVCQAGRLMAIMGPSGAGKTSLLDILAGRKNASAGSLVLGETAVSNPRQISKNAAYCQQDDAIMASQTVREAIRMAALLTLPNAMSYGVKVEKAEQAIKTFALQGCADTLVGDPVGKLKGISGGERKRCAVAMNAVREPSLIFLDEPTSGLDTHKAYVLVQVLKQLAQERSATVVLTIHQPSSDIFALLDDLMLLLDGNVVFNAAASASVQHFGRIGFECPQYSNPADYFFMRVLVGDDGGSADEARVTQLCDAWKASDECQQVESRVASQVAETPSGQTRMPTVVFQNEIEARKASICLQLQVLLVRAFNDVRRDKMRGKAQIGQALVFAVIISLIWLQVTNDQNGIQNRSGALFFIVTTGVMNNIMGVLTTFSNERGAVIREQENNMYDTLPYFMARVLVDLPLKMFCPLMFGTIVYWAVGFQVHLQKYLVMQLLLVILALSSNSFGLFLACVFPDVAIALAVAPIIILPLMMFSGFFLNPESTPVWLKWVEYISPIKYGFSALVVNEFEGLKLHCTDDQLRKFSLPNGEVTTFCPVQNGQEFIDAMNIQEELTIEVCILILAGLGVLLTILAFAGLKFVTYRTVSKSQAATKKKT